MYFFVLVTSIIFSFLHIIDFILLPLHDFIKHSVMILE